jgi:hypothetical protein
LPSKHFLRRILAKQIGILPTWFRFSSAWLRFFATWLWPFPAWLRYKNDLLVNLILVMSNQGDQNGQRQPKNCLQSSFLRRFWLNESESCWPDSHSARLTPHQTRRYLTANTCNYSQPSLNY